MPDGREETEGIAGMPLAQDERSGTGVWMKARGAAGAAVCVEAANSAMGVASATRVAAGTHVCCMTTRSAYATRCKGRRSRLINTNISL